MKILITGGAGFIGSNFIHRMQKKHPDYVLICVDSLTYAGNMATLGEALGHINFRFYKEDITSRDSIFNIFEKELPDIVVNFAAESHVDRSITEPGVFLNTNIIGAQVLLDASLAYHVSRYHQVSTDEVYGDLPLDRPDLLFTEDSPLIASSPYSASKAAADLLVMSYFRTHNSPVTISRCSNNYGPYQYPEKLIPLMLTKALNNEPLPVYGSGINIRDWIYVEDHCSAIEAIITHGRLGEVYNIGANQEETNLFIVKTILKKLDKPETLISFVEDRKGHDLRYAIDNTKLKRDLKWAPETSFETGIEKTIEWYLNNKTWVDTVLRNQHDKQEKR